MTGITVNGRTVKALRVNGRTIEGVYVNGRTVWSSSGTSDSVIGSGYWSDASAWSDTEGWTD
jgi:hypothetical protein